MHPEQIKAEIRMAGLTATEVARQLNPSRMTVSQVIRGTGRSAHIEVQALEAAQLLPLCVIAFIQPCLECGLQARAGALAPQPENP